MLPSTRPTAPSLTWRHSERPKLRQCLMPCGGAEVWPASSVAAPSCGATDGVLAAPEDASERSSAAGSVTVDLGSLSSDVSSGSDQEGSRAALASAVSRALSTAPLRAEASSDRHLAVV